MTPRQKIPRGAWATLKAQQKEFSDTLKFYRELVEQESVFPIMDDDIRRERIETEKFLKEMFRKALTPRRRKRVET